MTNGLTPTGEICPIDECVRPWRGCSQCLEMCPAWTMLPFTPFAGLNPHILWAESDCSFTSSCYLGCIGCPSGMAAVWYVQLSRPLGALGSSILTPGDYACEFTNHCPAVPKVII